MAKRQNQLVLKDTDEIKNIVIQINLKFGSTMVISNYSAWENLALIMEALAVTAQKCIEEGVDKEKVYQEIDYYMSQALKAYKILGRND